MRFFNLVQQDNGIGFPAHRLGEVAALLVADITRRRADQAGDGIKKGRTSITTIS
jgi:hypothetical protein